LAMPIINQMIEHTVTDTDSTYETERQSRLRILMVDDDTCFLEVAAQILTLEHNFDVQTVSSVDQALKALETQPFDAIISDYEMPQKNGIDFLRELRRKRNETPFVMFTGRGREEVAVTALNLGADRYINKHGSPETVFTELSDAVLKTVERKQSKKMLRESEEKYRTLVEESLQGILVAQGRPPRIVFANESFAKTLGYSTDEITLLNSEQVAGLVHAEDQKKFFERYTQRLMGQQKDSTFDFRAIRKDGTSVWLQVSSNRILYNGKPAVQGIFLNIDNDKKASENIQKNEARYQELANSLPEMVFETDANGKITFYNRAGCEITGYTPEDLRKGINIIDVIVPDDKSRAEANAQKVMIGRPNGPNEYRLLKKDGEILQVLTKTTPFILENGSIGLRGILVDITERKQAEETLKRSEERLNAIILNAPIGIATSDSNKYFLTANPAFCKILGYSEAELQKLTFRDITVEEDVSNSISNLQRLCEGKVPYFNQEKRYIRKDGAIIDGKITVSAVRDKEQKPMLFIAELEDITHRKTAERNLAENQKRLQIMNEKLRVVGSLTRHDVRNKICGISGNSYILKKKLSNVPELFQYIQNIEDSCREIEKLFEFVRTYEQLGVDTLTYVSLQQAFNDALKLFLNQELPSIINNCDGVMILADSLLTQLFYNLIGNSIKHGKKVTSIAINLEKENNGTINLLYEDDGIGIPQENKARLFKMGFSTGGSTGYGLYLIKKMVEVYGWSIQENGEPGKGARFIIRIPPERGLIRETSLEEGLESSY
jgi:PAS domain S-box-containing protein